MAGMIGQLLMPDMYGAFKQGQQDAIAENRRKTLAQYVQPALGGDQSALAKIYSADPDAGMQVQRAASQQAQLKGQLADQDMVRLGKHARMITALADAGDVQGAASLYSTIYPEASKILGPGLPQQFDPSMLPHMKQIADAVDPQKPNYVKGSPGDVFVDTSASGRPAITVPGDKAPPQSIQELQYLQQHPDLLGIKTQLAAAGRQPRQPSDIERKLQLAQSMGATPEQLKQMVLGSAGTNGAPDVPGDKAQSGDAYLKTLDPQTAAQVKALSDGRMAFPTGTALKSPYWEGMLGAVSQYDPSFDAVNYNARSATRKGFTSGKEAQTVNSLNTVAEHLGTLSDYIQNLHNTSFQPYNALKNKLAGLTGDPDIARFNTAKKAVADEVAKVWRNSGGSEADIQENLKNLDGAQSPEQLNAAVATLTKLISGKVSALNDQYTQGMGKAQDVKPLVSPEAQAAYDKVLKRGGENAPAMSRGHQSGNEADPLGIL